MQLHGAQLVHILKIHYTMLKNEFSERTNVYSSKLGAEFHKNKLHQMFAPKTYAQTNKSTFLAANVLSYICNAISILSAVVFIGVFLHQSTMQLGTITSIVFAVVLSSLLVFLVEVIKRGALHAAIKQYLMYKKFRVELAIVSIIAVLFSVFTSFYGAKQLPQITTPSVATINVDSIQNVYTAKIDKATVLHTYKPTNTITKQGAKIIAQLEVERATEIERARTENQTAQISAESRVQKLEYTFCTVVAINELLLILCVLFVLNYQFRSYLELRAHEPTETPKDTKDLQKSLKTENRGQFEGVLQPHQVSARGIGFRNLATNEKSCKNCGEIFVHNHKKQLYCNTSCRMQYHNRKRVKTE